MKQFDLQEFLKNPTRPIVTRDGHDVRIICTNRIDKTHPVLALLFEDEDRDREEVYQYTSKGEYYSNARSPHDLCFAPIKKEGWINVYRGNGGHNTFVCNRIFATKEEARREKRDIIATIKIEWEEDNGQD